MIAVIIEYELNDGVHDEFTSVLRTVLPAVATIDGFIHAEAAQSLEIPGKYFELSYWRDRDAVAAWSRHPDHLVAKRLGREKLLKWYRIIVSEVTADWGSQPKVV